MLKVIALVTQSVIQSGIKNWVDARCAERGAEVVWHSVTESCREYTDLFRSADNVLTWNCRMPHSWLTKDSKNVLFLDNSLISQKAGIFVDSEGFFSKSSLKVNRTWSKPKETNLSFIAARDFKWSLFSKGSADGPILVALQLRTDCNVHFEFPLAKKCPDKVVAALELLKQHLPRGRKVLIRPHPRESEDFDMGGVWRDDWRLSFGGSFAEILPKCSALVSVNSTCISEAALLGLPTASLGDGAFSGSGISLECSSEPEKLAALFDFTPDIQACANYCKSVLSNHFIPYDVKEGRSISEFDMWLDHLK